MASRRRRGNGSAGPPASWITTYGDMMSLLLCFFVLLFALSTIDARKFEKAILSLQGALGLLPAGGGLVGEPTPVDLRTILQELEREDFKQLEEVEKTLAQAIGSEGLEGQIEMSRDSRGLVVRFCDSVLFDLGKADLRPEARVILDKVAQVIKGIPNHVRVEGHTDDLPIGTERFPSNWELSTGRSSAVIRYLIERHVVPATRLSAAGYGEYRPIVPNDSEDNRRKNRRVDIVILRLMSAQQEPDGMRGW